MCKCCLSVKCKTISSVQKYEGFNPLYIKGVERETMFDLFNLTMFHSNLCAIKLICYAILFCFCFRFSYMYAFSISTCTSKTTIPDHAPLYFPTFLDIHDSTILRRPDKSVKARRVFLY